MYVFSIQEALDYWKVKNLKLTTLQFERQPTQKRDTVRSEIPVNQIS